MIKLKDYTPEIYYKESRDFQFIGRLYDLALNYVKTNVDLIYNIPMSDNSDSQLLDLMAMTLGFKLRHHYNAVYLRAICSVLSEILRNKGSINAIKIACNSLFKAAGIEESLDYDFTSNDHTELNLYIPETFQDTTLLNDLLDYILPAGMSCNIIRELRLKKTSNTKIKVNNVVTVYNKGEEGKGISYDNDTFAVVPKIVTGASNRSAGKLGTDDLNTTNIADNVGFIPNWTIKKEE